MKGRQDTTNIGETLPHCLLYVALPRVLRRNVNFRPIETTLSNALSR